MNEHLFTIYNILSILFGNDLNRRRNAEIELELLKKKDRNEFLVNLLQILNHQKINLDI